MALKSSSTETRFVVQGGGQRKQVAVVDLRNTSLPAALSDYAQGSAVEACSSRVVELEAWCMTGGTQAYSLVRASCDLWRLLKWAAEAPGVITHRFPMSRFGEAVCVMRSGRAARWWRTDAAEAPLQHRMTDEDRREKGEWRLAHQHTDLAKAMLDILKRQKANA